jgi:hypothetical protein
MAIKYVPFYNIEKSVGKGGVNNSEDVLLVQYFLSQIGKMPPHPLPPPGIPLTVNGVVTPLLYDWIDWFQKCVKKIGKPIVTDGKIDPAKVYGGSIRGGNGTIVHLNATYRNRFRMPHNALETAPGFPPALGAKFADDGINM